MPSSQGKIQIVQGGQWGSEAKGAIAAYLCRRDGVHIAVRTGATNAGHTVIFGDAVVKMQQLPVGFVNPNVQLVVGAGALVDIDILGREIDQINALMPGSDVRDRLILDPRAAIHRPSAAERSKRSNRHHLIGATGKGCSEALIDRIRLRGREKVTIAEEWGNTSVGPFGVRLEDTEKFLNKAYDKGALIQLEATQGQLLDLYLGPYPYTTHKQTGPAQWMMEAGLSPALRTDIVGVYRTFPIRVAGNSGPMDGETTWPSLARAMNNRLRDRGLPPIVREESLREFEDGVREAIKQFDHPAHSDGLDQHIWSAEMRLRYKEALSETNTLALRMIRPSTLADLKNLFEFTTVTLKLRRIAYAMDRQTAASIRQMRPHRVALTFMNYPHPEQAGSTHPMPSEEEKSELLDFERRFGVAVTHFNRGPREEHIIKFGGR